MLSNLKILVANYAEHIVQAKAFKYVRKTD